MQYYAFYLKRGDAFCYDVNYKQDAEDIRRFLNKVVENGNFPVTTSYGDTVNMTMKMFDAVGLNVVFLKRTQIGDLRLGGLGRGLCRPLAVEEVLYLKSL